jgi:hypothetical protein
LSKSERTTVKQINNVELGTYTKILSTSYIGRPIAQAVRLPTAAVRVQTRV